MSLDTRLKALEATDDEWTLYRKCGHCGLVVLNSEACSQHPPCTMGVKHTVPDGPIHIVIPPLRRYSNAD